MSKVLPFALILLAAASDSLALGGHEVRIDALGTDQTGLAVDVTATADGALFASCHGDTNRSVLNIYRSDDGGTTWALWSALGSLYAGGEVYDAEIAATAGSPGTLVVGWIDRNSGMGSGSAVRFSSADADAAVPVWSHALVDTDGGFGVSNPNIATREVLNGSQWVALAWDHADDVTYASSTDGGVTWSTPTSPYIPSAMTDLDLAVDALGVVHLAYTTFNYITDTGSVVYGRATSRGEDAGDWDAAVTLVSLPDDRWFNRVAIAADPDGPGVFCAGWSQPDLHVQTSSDNGAAWTANSVWPGLSYPHAAWGDAGAVLAAGGGNSGRSTIQILQPETLINGPWTSQEMVLYQGSGTSSHTGMAIDPSRGGLPMAVYMMEAYADYTSADAQDLWFDADWRDAPGYGVPAAGPVILSESGAFVRAPLPADLDGDGDLEIVFTEASSDTAHTLRWRGLDDELDVFATDDLHPTVDIALVDLDGDGDHEVFHFRPDATLMGYHGDGTPVAGFPLDLGLGTAAGRISGSGVTGAPGEELVVASGPYIWVLGPGGALRPGFPFSAPGGAGPANGRVAIGDVDADGDRELVASFTGGAVILDHLGQVAAPLLQGGAAPGSPSLADLDGDGDLEIAIPREDGTVELLHHDGTTYGPDWPYDTGAPGMPSQVALADVFNDGARELLVMDNDRGVHRLSPSGAIPPGGPVDVDPATAVLEPMAAELGPQGMALAVGGADGVFQLRLPGAVQEGWPRDLASPVTGPATAADLDGDGLTDLIIPTADALWILHMGVARTADLADWAVSGADVGRSGWADRPATSTAAAPIPASGLRLTVAPNPFNPRTKIRFRLGDDVPRATVAVFDPRGRRVRTLHHGPLTAGDHAMPWSGRTDAGRDAPSGVYFCRVEAGGRQVVRSLVLVR